MRIRTSAMFAGTHPCETAFCFLDEFHLGLAGRYHFAQALC